MKARRLTVVVVALVLAIAFLVPIWLMGRCTSSGVAPARAATLPQVIPTITSANPASAPNDLDTRIAIIGTGFAAGLSGTLVITAPTAYLGSTTLGEVTWVNTTPLSATVPWGLDPGVYTLTMANPDGGAGSLPDAFTVTQGIGVLTTGVPYGGNVHQLTLHPITPTIIYANGGGGMFVSRDGMGHWEYLLPNSWLLNLSISPSEPDVLYVGSYYGLYRSTDDEESWKDITIPQHDGRQAISPWTHPATPGTVYVTPHPIKTFQQLARFSRAPYLVAPCTFVACEWVLQTYGAKPPQAEGMHYVELSTAYDAMITAPRELADILLDLS